MIIYYYLLLVGGGYLKLEGGGRLIIGEQFIPVPPGNPSLALDNDYGSDLITRFVNAVPPDKVVTYQACMLTLSIGRFASPDELFSVFLISPTGIFVPPIPAPVGSGDYSTATGIYRGRTHVTVQVPGGILAQSGSWRAIVVLSGIITPSYLLLVGGGHLLLGQGGALLLTPETVEPVSHRVWESAPGFFNVYP